MQIAFSVSVDEYRDIRDKVQQSGLSTTNYLRQRVGLPYTFSGRPSVRRLNAEALRLRVVAGELLSSDDRVLWAKYQTEFGFLEQPRDLTPAELKEQKKRQVQRARDAAAAQKKYERDHRRWRREHPEEAAADDLRDERLHA